MINNNKNRALFCVTGSTPQILTETLYALCVKQPQPWIPDIIKVVTTNHGKKMILEKLFDNKNNTNNTNNTNNNQGQFTALCKDYDLLNQIQFDESCIIVPKSKDNIYLEDVRDNNDNIIMGDTILQTIQKLIKEYQSVHVSISGGRKTMSYYAGSALMLYGRPTDQLSHVLVNKPFDDGGVPDFYFPPKTPINLNLRNNINNISNIKDTIIKDTINTICSSKAEITLADMPFLRVNARLPPNQNNIPVSFAKEIKLQQAASLPLSLAFDFENRIVKTSLGEIILKDTEFFIYAWFALVAEKRWGTDCEGNLKGAYINIKSYIDNNNNNNNNNINNIINPYYEKHFLNYFKYISEKVWGKKEYKNKQYQNTIKGIEISLNNIIDLSKLITENLSKIRRKMKLAWGSYAEKYDINTPTGFKIPYKRTAPQGLGLSPDDIQADWRWLGYQASDC